MAERDTAYDTGHAIKTYLWVGFREREGLPKPYVNSTRIGAADDIASGRSTFLVEMTEVSTIIHQATADSLVVLDEVGRGTATYDGMALAEAIVEHLHTVTKCRGI